MNCKKAQQLFDVLSSGRLSETLSHELRRHLDDCTDCRVLEQRAARLQRLLALKRHERPAPEYFQNFLGQFHERLQADTGRRAGLWGRLVGRISSGSPAEPLPVWRYGFAGAAAITLAIGLTWMSVRPPSQTSGTARAPIIVVPSPETLAAVSVPAPQSAPHYITSPSPRSSDIFAKDDLLLVPATEQPVPSTPRYVLDRITITPASYEVANVHF